MQDLTPRLTADGSYTFFSAAFNEAFHSTFGARQEAVFKFVRPTHLPEKAAQPALTLLDICYGLGYNTAAALEAIWTVNPDCRVRVLGLELDPGVAIAALNQGFLNYSPRVQAVVEALATTRRLETEGVQARLLIGDARQTIQQVYRQGIQADAVFLDPFSPPHCPQLWTVEFLGWVRRCLHPQGRLATYSCAAAVRAALLENGFLIGSTAPIGRRSPGTVASFLPLDLPPLSPQEQEHLHTRAAIPYRAPELIDSATVILERRQLEQQHSALEATSQWKKRWFAEDHGSRPRGDDP